MAQREKDLESSNRGSTSGVAGVIEADAARSPGHTPALWTAKESRINERVILMAGINTVAHVPFDVLRGFGQMRADAARIVACVNACAGVPTDALAAAARTAYTAMPLALGAAIADRARLAAVNEGLVVALEKAADTFADASKTFAMFGKHMAGIAMQLAEKGCRDAIAAARTSGETP